MSSTKYQFDADRHAAAKGELTLHIGTKNRSGLIRNDPRPYNTASPGVKRPADRTLTFGQGGGIFDGPR